jgi:hypothetical protein
MRQQIAQGERLLRRPQLWRALGVEAGQNLWRGECGIDIAGRLVQLQLAALDELQRRHRGQQLDHRGDAKNRVGRHRRRRGHVAQAERPLIDHRCFVGGHRHDAGDFTRSHFRLQRGINLAAVNRLSHRRSEAGQGRERNHAGGSNPCRSQQCFTPTEPPRHSRSLQAEPGSFYPKSA